MKSIRLATQIETRAGLRVQPSAVRAFSEKAESEGDSHAGTNMIQASCWEEASMDGEAVFGGLACTRNRRG